MGNLRSRVLGSCRRTQRRNCLVGEKDSAMTTEARAHDACCAVSSCNDNGCRLTLPKARICISGARYQQQHKVVAKLCDFVVFTGNVGVAIELKSGAVDATHCREQLQNGANLVESLAQSCPTLVFASLLVHKGLRPMEAKILRQPITFRGRKYPTSTSRCGTALSAVAGTGVRSSNRCRSPRRFRCRRSCSAVRSRRRMPHPWLWSRYRR